MAKLENTVECIETLMDAMSGKGIAKLEYSCEEFDLKLETPAPASITYSQPVQVQSSGTEQPQPVQSIQPECLEAVKGHIVKSPIVGTYYSSPAPGKPSFITVGQKVKKGDVLMIIESMKLMNEIQSEFDGIIAEIMVADATAVEFDQPLIRIE